MSVPFWRWLNCGLWWEIVTLCIERLDAIVGWYFQELTAYVRKKREYKKRKHRLLAQDPKPFQPSPSTPTYSNHPFLPRDVTSTDDDGAFSVSCFFCCLWKIYVLIIWNYILYCSSFYAKRCFFMLLFFDFIKEYILFFYLFIKE